MSISEARLKEIEAYAASRIPEPPLEGYWEDVALRDMCAEVHSLQAENAEYNEELAKCREIVGATSENLSVDLHLLMEETIPELKAENAKLREIAKEMHEALRFLQIQSWYDPYAGRYRKRCEACAPNIRDTYKAWDEDTGEIHTPTCLARPGALENKP